MMHKIPAVLSADEVGRFRRELDGASWTDGRATAGHVAARAKRNLQLSDADPAARRLSDAVFAALGRNPAFIAAALPLKVFPPRFNRYEDGGCYGAHVDNAILGVPDTPHRIRSDLSATLFLSDPGEYDGGELVIRDTYGSHAVRLPAGHLVLYPSTSLHEVTPVTRGARVAAFFWIQSLVRTDEERALLFDLDRSIQELVAGRADDPVVARLSGVYHNLLRRWSST